MGQNTAARMDKGGESAAARTDFGSCCLGNCTFGKLRLKKVPGWENAFEEST